MKHSPITTFQIQLLIQLLGILLFQITNAGPFSQAILSGIALCIVGIPHGANDYLYREDQSISGLLKFLYQYVGVIVLYLFAWWFVPNLALVVFFLISLHHFGQSNFENDKIWHIPSILWGLWILFFPVLLHFGEALSIFNSMVSFRSYEGELAIQRGPLELWQVLVICSFTVFYIISLLVYERKNFISYFLQFLLVTIWYTITPLLFGFIMVFCLWHSVQSLQHQAQHFKVFYARPMHSFLYAMLPFSAIALLAFIVYVAFFGFNISLSFILLSLISLPHVIVMHQLYQRRERSFA